MQRSVAACVMTMVLATHAAAGSAGWPDPAFGLAGRLRDASPVHHFALLPDGRLLSTGSPNSFAVMRYLPNGAVDTSFVAPGPAVPYPFELRDNTRQLQVHAD